MKKIIPLFILLSIIISSCTNKGSSSLENQLQIGDIVFQDFDHINFKHKKKESQSPYSHIGIIYKMRGRTYVYEASQMVRFEPLDDWKKRSNNQFVVKRIVNADSIFVDKNLNQLRREFDLNLEKDYDTINSWDDSKMYNSEIVWKVFKKAYNIDIATLESKNSEPRISIKKIYESPKLKTVKIQ